MPEAEHAAPAVAEGTREPVHAPLADAADLERASAVEALPHAEADAAPKPEAGAPEVDATGDSEECDGEDGEEHDAAEAPAVEEGVVLTDTKSANAAVSPASPAADPTDAVSGTTRPPKRRRTATDPARKPVDAASPAARGASHELLLIGSPGAPGLDVSSSPQDTQAYTSTALAATSSAPALRTTWIKDNLSEDKLYAFWLGTGAVVGQASFWMGTGIAVAQLTGRGN